MRTFIIKTGYTLWLNDSLCRMKRFTTSIFLLIGAFLLVAQVPSGYYYSAEGLSGKELKTALHQIIRQGKRLSYGSGSGKTWSGFEKSDIHPDGHVWDMYSLNKRYFPGGGGAASGMNIEHSVAKSWWGGTNNDAYKDLYHLNPSDVSANSARSNYPLGINNGSKFNNGSIKVGNNTYGTEYTGLSFEPLDEYKGDFARAYMYMFTCYENFSWTGTNAPTMLVKSETWPMLRNWARNMLLEWHRKDPVSEKERKRMAAIYPLQDNRNPYIDYPELVEFIWGTSNTQAWYPGAEVTDPDPEDPDETEQFTALPATNISFTGFTANWTAVKDATTYRVHVYTIEENDTPEELTILDIDFAEGLPLGWSKTGYTDTQTSGSLRLASGSNPGVIISDEIDLSTTNNQLTVRARQYSNDTGATLTVTVDETVIAEWNTAKDNQYYSVDLPTGTETSVITLSAKANRRVYLDELVLKGNTIGSSSVSVPGFPVLAGQALSYVVSGLEPDVTYYYTVEAIGANTQSTSAVPVTTLIVSGIPQNSYDTSGILIDHSGIHLDLMEETMDIALYSPAGKLLYSKKRVRGREQIALPEKGIYLLKMTNQHISTTHKLIF